MAVIVLFALGFVFLKFGNLGYQVVNEVSAAGASNPRRAEVIPAAGAWLANYVTYPWMWIAPIVGFAGPVLALIGLKLKSEVLAFGGSSLGIFGIIGSVGASMFPIILPSSLDAQSSLLVWTASSSHLTLFIMLLVTVIFLPIVLAYTAWVYKVLFGRVGIENVRTNPDLY
ncbi:MAG: cytochrome d ubiquinol oxidase subunit II [Asticcacaulis sp. 32-58-5]|nr:MAG: cytochrome d ubiquinol oxidase subunit II [Asticcacaulis sp. 32-58-5]